MKRHGDTLLVYLEGELDLHTAQPFRAAVSRALDSDPRLRNVVLHMARVSFVDSCGVGAILGRYRDVEARRGKMAAVGLQVPVRRIFELAGVARVIEFCETEGEALATL